jgi:RecA-family ATPase
VTPEIIAAEAWYAAGCTPIPIRLDGSKAPLVNWRELENGPLPGQHPLATFTGEEGLAIVCGAASGNLEMLEIEGVGIAEGIDVQLAALADNAGIRTLLDRVAAGYYESSPKGGVHMFYRVADGPALGNVKLAERPARDDELTAEERERVAKHGAAGRHIVIKRTLIETRGHGGYVIVAPTRAEASDPAGPYGRQPWVWRWGSPATIATITADERRELHALCRSMHVAPPERPTAGVTDRQPALPGVDGDRPGDVFARTTTWAAILEPHGWRRLYQHGGKTYWCRPGKTAGVSATTTDDGPGDPGGLYVFSSSTTFEPETLYTKFGAMAHLEHGGDMRAAAAELAGPAPVYSDFFGTWRAPQPPEPAAVGAVSAPPAGNPDNPWQAARDRLYGRMRTTATIDDRPLPRYIVDGWLKYDEIAQIIGASGSMKSFVAIDLAAAIATGSPWHGSHVQRHGVMFVAAEGGSGIRKRIRAWEKHHERRADGLLILDEPVQIATRLGRGLQPSIEWQALAQIVYETKTAVLFVDTQARSTVGINENDNSEMGVVFDAVDQLRRAVRNQPDGHEVTVGLIHHTGKAGADGRGASAMYAAVNTELRVAKKKVGAETVITVSNSKNKDDEEAAAVYLTAQIVGMEPADLTHDGSVRQGDESTSSVVLMPSRWRPPRDDLSSGAKAGNPLDDNDRLALVVQLAYEIVGDTTQTGLTSLVHAGIIEKRGVNRRTAQRWVAEAVEAKLLKTTSGANARFTLSSFARSMVTPDDNATRHDANVTQDQTGVEQAT